MAKAKSSLTFRHETEVAVPGKALALPIPVHQWEQLRVRISQCEEHSPFYEGLGWGLLGAGIGTFAALIALLASVDFIRAIPEEIQPGGKLVAREELNRPALISSCILAIMTIGCLGVGIISLRFSSMDRTRRRTHAGTIAAEMQTIRGTFEAGSGVVGASTTAAVATISIPIPPAEPLSANEPEPKTTPASRLANPPAPAPAVRPEPEPPTESQ